MKKLGMVLGVAAVATLAGCKDPDYNRGISPSQNEVKSVETEAAVAEPAPVETAPAKKCACAPGTKHTSPCACGADNCMCIVETKPVAPAEPEYTIYIVQPGDYVSKISKKFNVRIDAIRSLNNLKKDVVRVGQKLKLPGKINVGEQKAPAAVKAAPAAKSAKKVAYAPYTGATKEYVVKNGDTLGKIAYGNGINIRQLKELNKLTSDSLKLGQKLKIPAEKVVAKPSEKVAEKPVEVKSPAEPKAEPAPAEVKDVPAAAEPKVEPVVEPKTEPQAKVEEAADAVPAPATTTYVVQDGEDIMGVAVKFGCSPAEIRELNNLGENDKISAGKILKLPADVQQ